VLRRRNWRKEQTTPREDLLRACRSLVENRDFATPWTQPDFERDRELDRIVSELRALGALNLQAKRPSDPLAKALKSIDAWGEKLEAREELAPRDYDGLESELTNFERDHERDFKQVGSGVLYGASLDRAAVVAARDAV